MSASGGASGNPVTFTASGQCTSSGLNGSSIAVTTAGSCTVTTDQAGNANFSSAAPVPQTFAVNAVVKQEHTITFNDLANMDLAR